MEERRTVRVALADELDRSPAELDRARGGTDLAGELGRPGAELGEVEPGELGRVRHRVPERERPLEVRERLGESEDGLRFACRLDRRDQRVGAATRRLPVRRELRRRRGSAARELFGQLRVQLLALAGQDRRVDRLRQERVAEAEAAGRLVGDEDAVLDRPAQRLAHVRSGSAVTARSSGYATSRPAAAASRSRPCVRRSSRATRCSRRSRRPRGSSALGSPAAARSSSAKKGLPSARATISFVSVAGSGAVGASRKQRRQLVALQRPEARAGAPSPSAGRRRQVGACARPTTARRRGRWRAAEPLGRRGCARGRRRDRASRYPPSGGPRARAAPVRRLLCR